MVSKNQIKLITSLQQKKIRAAHGLFVAEGRKVIGELLDEGFELYHLYSTEVLFDEVATELKSVVSESELKKISALSAANNCLAVFKIKEQATVPHDGFILALDNIRDPGNLGTIIRLCDWFGIRNLVCSEETVDLYNPKVVQATMGSLARVDVHYIGLEQYLLETKLPVFGTFMNGKSIYAQKMPENAILVMGNEANGITPSIEKHCTERVSIPRFGEKTESLNVASATAIFLSEFRR